MRFPCRQICNLLSLIAIAATAHSANQKVIDTAISLETSVSHVITADCLANSDADNDGIVLTIADMAYISDFLKGCGPAPVVAYSYDLNGNGVIDTMDIHVFLDYMTFGFTAFTPYGGYPVPCPCDPILVPYSTCCCTGNTGNVNESISETPDLSDLSLLISYMTQTPRPPLPCMDEANTNGIGSSPDLSDLSLLIAYLTQTPRPVLPNCS